MNDGGEAPAPLPLCTASRTRLCCYAGFAALRASQRGSALRLRQHCGIAPKIAIGKTTAASILSEIPHIDRFESAKAIAAFAGLSPRHRQSGTSIHGRPRLCKTGNSRLRKALYMPAMVALRFNPALRIFAERLSAAGKHKLLIIGAVMRKLLVLAYGILRSGVPFDANYA